MISTINQNESNSKFLERFMLKSHCAYLLSHTFGHKQNYYMTVETAGGVFLTIHYCATTRPVYMIIIPSSRIHSLLPSVLYCVHPNYPVITCMLPYLFPCFVLYLNTSFIALFHVSPHFNCDLVRTRIPLTCYSFVLAFILTFTLLYLYCSFLHV